MTAFDKFLFFPFQAHLCLSLVLASLHFLQQNSDSQAKKPDYTFFDYSEKKSGSLRLSTKIREYHRSKFWLLYSGIVIKM